MSSRLGHVLEEESFLPYLNFNFFFFWNKSVLLLCVCYLNFKNARSRSHPVTGSKLIIFKPCKFAITSRMAKKHKSRTILHLVDQAESGCNCYFRKTNVPVSLSSLVSVVPKAAGVLFTRTTGCRLIIAEHGVLFASM